MFDTAHTALLGAHVLAGIVALLAGAGAILTAKGSRRHNRLGKYYGVSMAFVTTSAVPLAVAIESAFLLVVAIFSGYLVFAGYRVIARRRRKIDGIEPIDWACHGSMIVVGAVMVGGGSWITVSGDPGLAPVLVVFGVIGGTLAVRELRGAASGEAAPWIDRHITFMGGGYIATVTAAVTVNLTMLPPLARWLGPTLIGVPLIVYATRTYRPVFAPQQVDTAD